MAKTEEEKPTIEYEPVDYLGNIGVSGITFDPESPIAKMFARQKAERERREAEREASSIEAGKLKALPSLPSVSNVGATPFTGVVNWNAIPGGFQPLPQTAGGSKKLYQLSQFHGGINQKSSPRDIGDFECQEATNVTVSQVGRIKLLGDIKGTDNSITTHAVATTDRGSAGYGLFQFTAPADAVGTVGEHVITLSADGDRIDAHDTTSSTTAAFIDYASADRADVAHVIYSAGNGVYACDANFSNTNLRKANIYVYRKDYDSSGGAADLITSGWAGTGKPLIDSPTFEAATGGAAAATDGRVALEFDDGSSGNFDITTVAGAATVHIASDNSGSWGVAGAAIDYYFYISWLFDGGIETGLTALVETGESAPSFDGEKLYFNFSVEDEASGRKHIGGDSRIEGARIYFQESGKPERFLLAEIDLEDGVKGALDSTFTPWAEPADDTFDLAVDMVFDAPPNIYTYLSLNGYSANEVYTKSTTTLADEAIGPTAHDIRYKTAVVGQQGVVFIGNVQFKGKHMPDMMMFSMPGKPAVFPKFNFFDSPSSDGSPITALAAFQDTILQFKENAMYAINVSNPAQFYAEASFRDCGVFNPCQVFTTAFGVIFANQIGCFIYDGSKVIALTSGKFSFDNWDLPSDEASGIANDGAGVPCVGYDPRSQSIIVLKDINDDSTDTGAWIYNMVTQSWTEGNEMITNANANKHTNFIITSGGYLSILRDDSASVFNYKQTNNAQKVIFQTKDLDFGLPSQTKKLFKVYITYQGNASNLTATWRYNGETTERGFTATNWADNSGTDDFEIATLVPDDATESKDWKSMSIYITSGSSTVSTDFEINDISILYRVRPLK